MTRSLVPAQQPGEAGDSFPVTAGLPWLGQAWITDAYRGPGGVGLFGRPVKALAEASSADRLAAFLGCST